MMRGAAIAIALCASFMADGCSSNRSFDLSHCAVLEPGLYRCLGSERPVCDPEFARLNEVECVRVSRDGLVLQDEK